MWLGGELDRHGSFPDVDQTPTGEHRSRALPQTASADSTPATATRPDRRTRDALAGLLDDFRDAQSPPAQRLFAQGHGLPRSTRRHGLRRQGALDAPPEEVAFFESAAGVALLHRLRTAAHLVFTQQGPCGLRLPCLFLRLARLDRFVAASSGAQQQFGRAPEEQTLAYEQAERPRLAGQMAPQEITACQDETFHPQVCLVALEPASHFLLLERHAKQRDQQTWDGALREALEGLPVKVVQTVGDQAQALGAHAAHGPGVPTGTDRFHLEHDLCKALAPALARHTRSEEKRLARVQARTRERSERSRGSRADHAQAQARPKGPGRPPDYPGQIARAEQVEAEVAQDVQTARKWPERLRGQLQDFSDADPPFDLRTGQAQSAEAVRGRLQGRLEALQGLAQEARLGPRATQAVAGVGKARGGRGGGGWPGSGSGCRRRARACRSRCGRWGRAGCWRRPT